MRGTARVRLSSGVVAAAILAVVYLILEPSSVDLAAQTFRADLFDANGFCSGTTTGTRATTC